ncbi:MAG: hypothetical protein LCH38_15165 [Proteobacteria bacterium]|nr:hypothetical protein [Pseudomonadota bacterium]
MNDAGSLVYTDCRAGFEILAMHSFWHGIKKYCQSCEMVIRVPSAAAITLGYRACNAG